MLHAKTLLDGFFQEFIFRHGHSDKVANESINRKSILVITRNAEHRLGKLPSASQPRPRRCSALRNINKTAQTFVRAVLPGFSGIFYTS